MYKDSDYAPKSGAGEFFNTSVRSGNVQNSFINRVFGWMFAGLALTGAVSWYLGTYWAEKIIMYRKAFIVLAIAEFLVVIVMTAGLRKFNAMVAALLFGVFALLNGITLSWIFMAYSTEVIAGTFFATSGTFGAMGLYGYLTKRDLSSVGSLCTMGLIGLIIASLVNMFWYNRTADLIISYIGVLLFVGLTAWDVQKIKLLAMECAAGTIDRREAKKYAILGALELYLDFINLFIFILRIVNGGRK
ncbi:MAG: Bax inhibitor-1/YccA family protein [Lentisphaeria bacterium]|nr:Bax inhibitor-1/YccA family protein [Lentisphaeria bacterium]